MSSLARAGDLFSDQCRRGLFPGGQLVVRRGGETLLDLAVGVARGVRNDDADPGPPVPVTPDTRFQVMSASKGVVAFAVAALVDKARLDVNAPVATYVPELAAHGKQDITVLDVLTHRSGLQTPELDARPEIWDDEPALTAALADLKPTYPRGTLAYNPIGYGWILAEVIRRVTGTSLPAYLKSVLPPALQGLELVLDKTNPAPVGRTYWLGPASHRVGGNDIAPRFEEVNNTISGVRALVPGAGMWTTARCLAAFYEALASGDLLTAATRERFTTRQTWGWDRSVRSFVALGRGFSVGWFMPHVYGWWNTGSCFGHPGGFSVVAFGDRKLQAGIAMVTNGNRSVGDLVRRAAPLGSAIRRALSP